MLKTRQMLGGGNIIHVGINVVKTEGLLALLVPTPPLPVETSRRRRGSWHCQPPPLHLSTPPVFRQAYCIHSFHFLHITSFTKVQGIAPCIGSGRHIRWREVGWLQRAQKCSRSQGLPQDWRMCHYHRLFLGDSCFACRHKRSGCTAGCSTV